MKNKIRLAIAQINCTVGDFEGNSKKICEYLTLAQKCGAHMVSFPELSVTGYPPEDLLLKKAFVDDNLEALKDISKSVRDIVAIVGFVDRIGKDIYNAAAVIHEGRIAGVYHKMLLPNYGVFDEKRYFTPGSEPRVFRLNDIVFGVNICEDIWHKDGPVSKQAAQGAGLIININASPYYAGRIKEREDAVLCEAKKNKVFISYTNLVGGQDELVFDGQSMIVDNAGKIITVAAAFREELLALDLELPSANTKLSKDIITIKAMALETGISILPKKETKPLDPVCEIYEALLLGLKDYVNKNNFEKVVIGLSGGIDSSLVAALAVDALGKDNVIGVFMPTRYSSESSKNDAKELAANLGIKFTSVSIEHIFKLYKLTLEGEFAGHGKDITEENIQARIRGNVLMALSNKFGWLVLTTGNKSEMSTGYATLYGDMAGGFAVIKDVYKTLVYKLARYRNSVKRVIPESVITKEPTAELKPNQKDSDTLPPYNKLDPILKAYIEKDKSFNEIVAAGFDKDTVTKVLGLVDNSEYKRRQSPPGVKITPKAFGRDRRMPITNKYR